MPRKTFTPVDNLKFGHSMSLDGHTFRTVDMLPARSAKLLPSRSPSIPMVSLDLSREQTEENLHRRQLHHEALQQNPSCFRKKFIPEGTTEIYLQRHLVKDFLCDIHKLKDTNDIVKSKASRYSYSTVDLSDVEYVNMAPLEDFVRPEDSSLPRSTGYEKGHIRSLMKFDTYGPTSSRLATRERVTGRLPQSPNIDRYSIIEPPHDADGKLLTHSASRNSLPGLGDGGTKTKRPNTGDTASTANSEGRFPLLMRGEVKKNYMSKSRNANDRASLYDESSAHLDKDTSGTLTGDNTNSVMHGKLFRSHNQMSRTGTAAGTLGYNGPAVSYDDRLVVDAFVKRTEWFRHYQDREKDRLLVRTSNAKERMHKRLQRDMADIERETINNFEGHLVLAKLEC